MRLEISDQRPAIGKKDQSERPGIQILGLLPA